MKTPALDPSTFSSPTRVISQFDLVILLYNMWKGLGTVGWNHASMTIEEFARKFNKPVKLQDNTLESLMYMAQMLDETGEYWHPQGIKWHDFSKKLINTRGQSYDANYNYIKGIGVK